MADEVVRKDVEDYLSMDEDALYTLLVPEDDTLYSPEGMLAKGRAIFAAKVRQFEDVICEAYRKRPSTIDNSVDLAALIATTLSTATSRMEMATALPFSALVVKMGLAEMCREE